MQDSTLRIPIPEIEAHPAFTEPELEQASKRKAGWRPVDSDLIRHRNDVVRPALLARDDSKYQASALPHAPNLGVVCRLFFSCRRYSACRQGVPGSRPRPTHVALFPRLVLGEVHRLLAFDLS